MLEFKEDLLQFIWRYKLLKPVPLITVSGKEISILKAGELNRDSGPDFFNAQIKINDIILAGNVEIHLKTSDWLKHGHGEDKNYDTIILHAVYENDITLKQNSDHNVEVLELRKHIDTATILNYQNLFSNRDTLPCSKHLAKVDDLKLISWLERMTIERMEEKVSRLQVWFDLSKGDYTQTFYISLLRNFGFKINSEPFELLAKQLPVQLLLKHADNLLQLEALLLGTSGLLENQFQNKYIQTLQNEFEYLRSKYGLCPIQTEIFKFSKLRPANFPTLRLAQLANIVHRHRTLFAHPHSLISYSELEDVLSVNMDGYWKNHYKMDGSLSDKDLKLGKDSIENIIVNTFAPFLFFYSKKTGKAEYLDLAIALLNQCTFENNSKTKLFATKKRVLKSAANSQAIINLYDNYCCLKKCLHCGVAASFLMPNKKDLFQFTNGRS